MHFLNIEYFYLIPELFQKSQFANVQISVYRNRKNRHFEPKITLNRPYCNDILLVDAPPGLIITKCKYTSNAQILAFWDQLPNVHGDVYFQ